MEDMSLVDEREEVMIPRNGGKPTLRKAHFLKPTFASNPTQDHLLLPPSPASLLSPKPLFNQIKNSRLMQNKSYPSEKWKTWVYMLKPKYQEIWKKAGIYDAILASTYKIPRDNKLLTGLAERWCGDTNTFILPWGEVTVTLEDIINLGSYSVLGVSVSTPLSEEFTDVFNGMREAHYQTRVSCKGNVTACMWVNDFMNSGKQLEHEAFLAIWLSRFVLIPSQSYIPIHIFPVAIHLSRGTRIMLAPVVLASIYRDMSLLRKSMIESSTCSNAFIRFIDHTDLVQMWAWERFPKLRPVPNVMKKGEPRSARWNGVELKVKDVSAALDSAGKSFLWRPYAVISSNCVLSGMYRANGQWIVVESDESEAFVRCLRVSEIVGLGYKEQYHPNRVAMQFGLDQDIPPRAIRSNVGLDTAWCRYNRPLSDVKLYVPPRRFESDVSSRYLDWWRGLVPNEDATRLPLISCGPKRDSVATPGSASNCHEKRPQDSAEEDNLTIAQLLSRTRAIDTNRNRNDAVDEQLMALCSQTCTKYLCMTKPAELSVPASGKCEERNLSTEKQIKQAQNVVASNGNYQEVSSINANEANQGNCTSEIPQLEFETQVLRPDTVSIIDTQEERRDETISKGPKLELKTRILRLEMIIDMIKTAKLAASSRGKIWRISSNLSLALIFTIANFFCSFLSADIN